jgi:DNA invertase Pin-like site-specific DNA recombinase
MPKKYSTKTYDVIVRVSKMNGRTEHAESTMTLDDQLALCKAAIAEQGGRVGKVFKALDQSGFSAVQSRPYQQAKARLAAGEAAGLAVAYDDRLARNWRKVGRFYDELEELDAEVLIAGMPGVDYRTANGRMMTGLMAVVADAQYQTYKARGERTIKKMLQRKVSNKAPYGYRRNGGPDDNGRKVDPALDGKALVPDRETAPVVRLIFEMRAQGAKWTVIAADLHARGVRSPSGGEYWVGGSLSSIVANRTYLGHVIFGDEVVRGAHEPLVDLKVFKAAQSTVPVVRTGKGRAGLASGLLRCGSCGLPLSVGRSGTRDATFYACRRVSAGKRCPKPVHIDKPRVDADLDRMLRDAAAGKSGIDLVRAQRQLGEAKGRLDTAAYDLEQFVLGTAGMSADVIAAGMRARHGAVEAARGAYDALLAQVEDAAAFPTSADAWDALSLEDQRLAAKSVIDHITVAPFKGGARAHSDVESRLAVVWR